MKLLHWINIISLCGIVTASSFAFPQTPTKLIEWQEKPMGGDNKRWADGTTQEVRVLDQVEIESITVGKPVVIGQEFAAGDDWLKDLVIRVRNVSGKPLVFVQVTLVLPQFGPGSPDVVYCYGCAPEEKAKGIANGEAVDLKMPGGGFYEFVKGRAVEQGGIAQINKAHIRMMWVKLPGDTTLVSGCIKTTDAKNACPLVRQP